MILFFGKSYNEQFEQCIICLEHTNVWCGVAVVLGNRVKLPVTYLFCDLY
jgi:hypothetical protein